jgi:deoxyuridine 5'-triphosphate nucleotidohydrolase
MKQKTFLATSLVGIIALTILALSLLFQVGCSTINYTSVVLTKQQSIDSAMKTMVEFEPPFPATWDTLWVQPFYMTKTWFIKNNNGKIKHQFTVNELDSINVLMYRGISNGSLDIYLKLNTMSKKQTKTEEKETLQRVFFTKVRDVKSPTRANKHDAGIDFYIPVIEEELINDIKDKNPDFSAYIIELGQLFLKPGQRILIPSGIKVWIENKQSALVAANKSGIATKRGLTFTAQVIDADYTGEIHIGLQNNSNRMVTLQSNDKIIQFLHTPIILSTMEEVTSDSYNDILESNTIDRGENGFGSTDKK